MCGRRLVRGRGARGRRRGSGWLRYDSFFTARRGRSGRLRRAAGGEEEGTEEKSGQEDGEVFHIRIWLVTALIRERLARQPYRAEDFSSQTVRPVQSATEPRIFFSAERFRFPSRMRRFRPRGFGEFCRRTFSRCIFSAAFRFVTNVCTASPRRTRASFRFVACERESCTVTLKPDGRCRSVTAVETLFTFCPPGPLERAKVSSRSASRSSIAN